MGEQPSLGIGPMNYACTGPEKRGPHPHNYPLLFAQEWGLPSTLLLLTVLAAVALALWKLLGRTSRVPDSVVVQSLLAAGLVAAGGYSLLSGVMVMPASQVAGLYIGGWLMGAISNSLIVGKSARPTALAVLMGATIICGAIATFSIIEAGKREYREALIPRLAQGAPRYWQQGKLCSYFDRYQNKMGE
jgi:hypothetical protein